MAFSNVRTSAAAICLCIGTATAAAAQPLGSFTWQLQPFCNRVTVTVTQNGSIYTLDGTEDQCGAAQKAPLVGVAAPNPDGTIGFGLNIVAPSGLAVPVQARISIATLNGTWSDSVGNSGVFAFGANTGGSPRPAATAPGDITGVSAGTGLTGGGTAGDVSLAVNPAVVQSRVTTACPAGQAIRTINQDGTAVCQAATGTGGGDITAVIAETGLLGGATTGDATLSVAFGGPGTANLAARSDHTHAVNGVESTAVGQGALPANTGSLNTAVGTFALGANAGGVANSAVGTRALVRNTVGGGNTSVGSEALQANVSGNTNTAVGAAALFLSTGSGNTAVGAESLDDNTTGNQNTAVGEDALGNTSTGSTNVGVGKSAGFPNTTGSQNTFVGGLATAGSSGLTNAAAIGAHARVDRSNSIVLGSINFVNGATSDVNVGIGTTSPDGRLEIATQEFASDILITTADGAPDLVTQASEGTLISPVASASGSLLFILRGQGYTGAQFEAGANLLMRTTEPWTPTGHGTRFEFQTAANGSGTPLTRMLIDHDGDVGIGTAAPLDRLHVAGDVRVGNCVRNSAGTQIAGTCASDARLKRDLTPFPPMLDRVARLRPMHYFWRAEAFPERGFGPDRTYGLVAQDVEQVIPELVKESVDGFKAVDYSELPLMLLQAIRELKAENDALKARVAALETRRREQRR